MQTTTTRWILAAILVGACANTDRAMKADEAPMEWTPITTAEDYSAIVVGRSGELDDGTIVTILADGTITGNTARGALTGTWAFEDGKFCREGMVGGTALERQCQIPETSGKMIRYQRPDGTYSPVYMLN